MTDHVALVRRSLAGSAEFDRRVREQGERLADALDGVTFDNDAATLGLELEVYAVDADDLSLAPIPEDVFDGPADKELGLHNAECNAAPSRFDEAGIDAQARVVADDLAATRERAREHGLEIVLDAMPAVAPAGGTMAYLDDVAVRADGADAEHAAADGADGSGVAAADAPDDAAADTPDDTAADTPGDAAADAAGDTAAEATRPVVPGPDREDPVVVARNMRQDPRYGALDNDAVRRAGGSIPFEVPGADLSFRTILFESLATSIQPHVQVPDVSAFPRYHNLATRTLGPLVALSANSPFLPGDCYDLDAAGLTPTELVDATHHELRVAAFEQSMNQGCRKVRVPDDLDAAADAVDHVVADDTFAPFLREWVESEDSAEQGSDDAAASWEFDYKRGTFWRWVRGVPGGDAVDGACDEQSLRIEYRPLPTQPTVRDIVGLQALTAGLLHGLVAADHPLADLPWDAAEASFYAAVADGLDADLSWVDAGGERTSDAEVVFAEVFEYAQRGLAEQGVPADARERYLGPIEARWERGVTPSAWKKDRVRAHLDDGADVEGALAAMQREYVDLSRERETFAGWL